MAKRRRPEPKTEPEGVISLAVNGHTLSGEQRNGVWRFTCPDWPDLAEKWSGDTITGNVIGEFMARTLAGAVTVRRLAEGG